jgi:hypothetical protein
MDGLQVGDPRELISGESKRGHHIEGAGYPHATAVNAIFLRASKLLPLAPLDGSITCIDWFLYVNTGGQATDDFAKLIVQLEMTAAKPNKNVK